MPAALEVHRGRLLEQPRGSGRSPVGSGWAVQDGLVLMTKASSPRLGLRMFKGTATRNHMVFTLHEYRLVRGSCRGRCLAPLVGQLPLQGDNVDE